MVRATIILSVVAAFIAVASAAPRGSLVDVDGGEYIGTGNINAQNALTHVVAADNLAVHDLVQDVDVASDEEMGSAMPMSSGRGVSRAGAGRARGGFSASANGNGAGCHDGCDDHGLLNHLLKRED